ncbi:hypothetical protein AAHA92_12832 [Salvia divinorum]|uniref:WRKY19-like zinc finger domain-containing protein n=1 Tax=Salvia divinorum TaxID=28513 RepID=A0ABD1H6C5_SALDI
MDARFHNLGSAANPQSDVFKNLCSPIQIRGTGSKVVYCADTTLRLDSPGHATPFTSAAKGVKRKWSIVGDPTHQQGESLLCLNLGHSSSSSDSKGSTATACTSMSSAKETEEESSMDLELDFTLNLGGDKLSAVEKSASSSLEKLNKWPKVDLQLSLFSQPAVSDITTVYPSSSVLKNATKMVTDSGGLNADEGSLGSPFFPSQTPHNEESICFLDQSGPMKTTSPGMFEGSKRSIWSLYCSWWWSQAHGGGRRCEFLGCTKSAEGRTDFCIAHGGGRRCSHEGCSRAARGKSGLCIRHGGGKRCQKESCKKSAEGLSGLCISHGGGRRCQYPECNKGAQGSTMFCKAHGGGKRCTYPECKKGAEGSTPFCKGHGGGKRCSFEGGGICPKSVHGGTLYCVAHGGGKRCAIPDCTKSARGRTEYCVRHGGGKRCKFEGCGKSAQGSTDFCKAHGGGKRCTWGYPGYEFGQGDAPCNTFARGKTGLCGSHGGLVQDKRVHGGATIGTTVPDSVAIQSVFTVEDIGKMENSMVTSTRSWSYFGDHQAHQHVGSSSSARKLPEGRVHGGNLIAMFAGGPSFNFARSNHTVDPSEPEKSFMTHQAWM